MNSLLTRVAALLRSVGVNADELTLTVLPAGGNNRLYRIRCVGGSYALKHYFSHPGDRRDRLGGETGFLQHLAAYEIPQVPALIAMDTRASLAIYEWIEGQRPQSVNEAMVRRAGQWFAHLNATRDHAEELVSASEASFSIAEALELVERRLSGLMNLSRSAGVDREAAALVDDMMQRWAHVKQQTFRQAQQLNVDCEAELPLDQRCISPSDFGFHNTLITPAGNLVFVDFEYAGWDDPAKMAADFFCQPAVPVSLRFWDVFMEEAFAGFPEREDVAARAQLLLPAFQLRWCAIALNLFSPVSLARRQFAAAGLEEGQVKRRQLKIAQSLFEKVVA